MPELKTKSQKSKITLTRQVVNSQSINPALDSANADQIDPANLGESLKLWRQLQPDPRLLTSSNLLTVQRVLGNRATQNIIQRVQQAQGSGLPRPHPQVGSPTQATTIQRIITNDSTPQHVFNEITGYKDYAKSKTLNTIRQRLNNWLFFNKERGINAERLNEIKNLYQKSRGKKRAANDSKKILLDQLHNWVEAKSSALNREAAQKKEKEKVGAKTGKPANNLRQAVFELSAQRRQQFTANPEKLKKGVTLQNLSLEKAAEVTSIVGKYKDLQAMLRGDTETPATVEEMQRAKNIVEAFMEMQPSAGKEYRQSDYFPNGSNKLASLKKGEIYTDQGFFFVGDDGKITGKFKLEITFTHGYFIPGEDTINTLGEGNEEPQWLLLPGSKFKYNGYDKHLGVYQFEQCDSPLLENPEPEPEKTARLKQKTVPIRESAQESEESSSSQSDDKKETISAHSTKEDDSGDY